MNHEYKILKNKYGETFANICRANFATIAEQGVLAKIITSTFAPTRALGKDLQDPQFLAKFIKLIYSIYAPKPKPKIDVNTTAEQLFDQAGYILYPECQTEADIQKFVKYYEPKEKLCTFYTDRLSSHRVWFAVKKDVDQIKRPDFTHPNRQDAYGTSVISIQFQKPLANEPQILSIKNRYNHTVENPDATFSNNLDNIIPGLTQAFEKQFGCVDLSAQLAETEIPGYVRALDGKYYRENIERNNVNFCENNVIIKNHQAFKIPSYDKIIADVYLIDLKNNQILNLNDNRILTVEKNQLVINTNCNVIQDGFTKSFGNIQKITIKKDKHTGERTLTVNSADPENKQPIILKIDQHNQIIGYENHNLKAVTPFFLYTNNALKEIDIPHVTTIDDQFLTHNTSLTKIDLPNVITIGDDFLQHNSHLQAYNLPKLEKVGDFFLSDNDNFTQIDFTKLQIIGTSFFAAAHNARQVNIPNVTRIGSSFMAANRKLSQIELPNVTEIGEYFLTMNKDLTTISLPSVTTINNNFLICNTQLNQIDLPKVTTIGNSFLINNLGLTTLNLPKVTHIGENFLRHNTNLQNLNLPQITSIDDEFLTSNQKLTPDTVQMPKLKKATCIFFFMYDNPNREAIIDKIFDRSKLEEGIFYDLEKTKPVNKLRFINSVWFQKVFMHQR